ncbi:hypothetical protein OK016_19100 [Vibrio chagasii]|nr:hypothetical protein [Vibrio chagasii]
MKVFIGGKEHVVAYCYQTVKRTSRTRDSSQLKRNKLRTLLSFQQGAKGGFVCAGQHTMSG